MDDTIATRRLALAGGGHVVIRLGRPRRSGRDWVCAFEIRHGRVRQLERARGVDSLQALQMAIEGARVRIADAGHRLVGTWANYPAGLPRFMPYLFGAVAAGELDAAVDALVARQAKRGRRATGRGRGATASAS